MSEMTTKQYKKLVASVGYFDREISSAAATVDAMAGKRARAQAELDAVDASEAEAVAAVEALVAERDAALALIEAAVVLPDEPDSLAGGAGASARDARVQITEN